MIISFYSQAKTWKGNIRWKSILVLSFRWYFLKKKAFSFHARSVNEYVLLISGFMPKWTNVVYLFTPFCLFDSTRLDLASRHLLSRWICYVFFLKLMRVRTKEESFGAKFILKLVVNQT